MQLVAKDAALLCSSYCSDLNSMVQYNVAHPTIVEAIEKPLNEIDFFLSMIHFNDAALKTGDKLLFKGFAVNLSKFFNIQISILSHA